VGSLNGRISRLEDRTEPVRSEAEDEAAEIRRALMAATVDELRRLKASRAVGFRRTEPEDIPGQYLSKPYTFGQLIELAIRRVWGREELDEDLMEAWTRGFKDFCVRVGSDLEKIEDDGS
jgi:hypothetical protein